MLLFGTGDVLIWRLSDGLLVQRLQRQVHTDAVRSLSFSPNSQAVVSGSEDKSAIVWDIRSGGVLLCLEGHSEPVDTVMYAPHGLFIATASFDSFIKIWDALTGACLHSFIVSGGITGLVFSSNFSLSRRGDRIATASGGELKIWSVTTGEELLTINHRRNLFYPVILSLDDAEVLVSCPQDKNVVAYDSRTGQLRRVFALSDQARCAAYSPGGDFIVLGEWGGELKVFDAKSGDTRCKFCG
ncbi:uncharacterized protein PHACADRAFT_97392 [Phanerochaete carnosa HHB-10118-sp]|uniref:Uncharacterized protein n=1 Tax=Phanerochaete carnosa (strain HHB-10118-sp) TaxID=650164 RepID=K5W7D5_PHACS|nr:uncharacterized protein PHACADRAFT_97392 [Phanerochaete carnosa HHB-10118-sp]EKM54864.1 hypothetical protein PHACADRAFT_97392 [Phanerochaete carnosa HHB-10118-sp]